MARKASAGTGEASPPGEGRDGPGRPGEVRRATIRDVAQAAGVSLGTVSRVINNHPTVRAAVRQRVIEIAAGLGYVPDAIAQSMRTQATRAIGCMVSDVANPLFAKMVAAAEEETHRADYNMILANSGDDPLREAEILDLFKRRRLDGVIMTISRDDDPATSRLMAQFPLPIVLIERDLRARIDTVACDHFHGATQALNYLFMLRHRRIGLVTVSTRALPGRARVEAFEAAYEAAGLPLDQRLLHTSGFSADYGFGAARDMLANASPPTAIIAGANQMAGVLKAARALGRAVPGDLSLISLGDTDLAELYTPPLTVVRWRSEQVGRTAARILIERLAAGDGDGWSPQRITLPTELVVRESCAPPATAAG